MQASQSATLWACNCHIRNVQDLDVAGAMKKSMAVDNSRQFYSKHRLSIATDAGLFADSKPPLVIVPNEFNLNNKFTPLRSGANIFSNQENNNKKTVKLRDRFQRQRILQEETHVVFFSRNGLLLKDAAGSFSAVIKIYSGTSLNSPRKGAP